MGNESGTWIMYGVEPDDPECIHTVDEAIEYINENIRSGIKIENVFYILQLFFQYNLMDTLYHHP